MLFSVFIDLLRSLESEVLQYYISRCIILLLPQLMLACYDNEELVVVVLPFS